MKPTTTPHPLPDLLVVPGEFVSCPPQPDDRVTDIYTKSGSLGLYNSILALLPDYGVGFVTLAAGKGSHVALDGLIFIE